MVLHPPTPATDCEAFEQKLRDDFERVICRIDEKNESVDEAIEAVTGSGKGEYFDAVKRFVQGGKI